MRFAVQTWSTDLDAVKAYARDAEAMGYEALWYGDGLWPWTHEGWTVLAEHCQTTGRDVGQIRRSVEVDVVVAPKPTEVEATTRLFLQSRGLADGHPLLETALIGDPAQCRDRILQHRDAGVTDSTLSFADFPAGEMLRLFAEQVLPGLSK